MKISLTNKVPFWAIKDPSEDFTYMGGEYTGGGPSRQPDSQPTQIILTMSNPGPVEVDFGSLPVWAKEQITLAVQDKVIKTEEAPVLQDNELPVMDEKKPDKLAKKSKGKV